MDNMADVAMTSRNFKFSAEDLGRLKAICDAWEVSQAEAVRRAIRIVSDDLDDLPRKSGEDGSSLGSLAPGGEITWACVDLDLLSHRVAAIEERVFGQRDGYTYGVVSFDEADVTPVVSTGKHGKKKKAKKGKKASS